MIQLPGMKARRYSRNERQLRNEIELENWGPNRLTKADSAPRPVVGQRNHVWMWIYLSDRREIKWN